MFWENLTKDEGRTYIGLRRELRIYEAWNALKDEEKDLVPAVSRPCDEHLILLERLSMIGWRMNVEIQI